MDWLNLHIISLITIGFLLFIISIYIGNRSPMMQCNTCFKISEKTNAWYTFFHSDGKITYCVECGEKEKKRRNILHCEYLLIRPQNEERKK